MHARWILSIVPCAALMAACGGSQPPTETAETRASETATEAASETGTEAAAEDAGEGEGAGQTEPEAEAEPEEPPKRSGPPAAEVITTEDVAFAFDYNASAMKEAHEKQCEPFAKGDPGKLAQCTQNERKKFHADVLWFRREPNSEAMTWLIYKRTGNRLTELFRSGFVFAEEQHDSVKIRLAGPAKGSQQVYAGYKTIPISVPTKYAIIIDDPKYGELKYNSKVGLVAAQNNQ